MLFRVLGPLEICASEGWTSISAPKWRALLATLLAEPGRVVSAERLVGELWGEEPPRGARKLVSGYVSRLRRLIDDPDGRVLVTRAPGYMATVTRADLDANTFEDLLAAGQRALEARHTDQAQELLGNALALWRGAAFGDVPLGPLTAAVAGRLEELRLTAVELRIEADLACGRQADLVPELRQLTAKHPLRERLWHQLMRVLQGCGRPAEALEVYARVRKVIASELGADPGLELQRLYQRILAGDMATAGQAADGTPTATAATASQSALPRQLPATVSHFTGRREELRTLDGLLRRVPGTGGTVVISVIGGTAGVGKTTLALHWAHQVASRFRDGQLYVNLRGFGPSGAPVTPTDAIRGFLDALGVPPERIPSGLDAQVGLYRSLMADRRMLIVLDNARDADQVRPLLPASPGCLVVVTSRSHLTGLIVSEAAQPVTLDLLSEEEARELLARRLGADRVTAESKAVAELTGLCARLPLPLVIAAARAAARPDFPLAALAAELRGTHTRLDALGTEDATTDVRTVFSWSYQQLTSPAASMFRLLSIHPGSDITAPAAASLAGLPRGQARRAMAELVRAHLVTEHVPGRFAFHDLLRTYAAGQALTEDSHTERRAAVHRMLDHYLHTACAAAVLFSPSRPSLTLAPAKPGVSPEDLADRQQAVAWLQAEHRVMLAAVTEAVATGLDVHAWQIPWALATFLQYRGHWNDYAVTQRAALAATQRLSDLTGQARAHYNLALAIGMAGSYADARAHMAQSLGLRQQLGDSAGQARSHAGLGWIFERQGKYSDALEHAQHALRLYRAAGDSAGLGEAIGAVGWYHALLGDYEQALAYCQEALALARESDDISPKAGALDTIGYAHHHLGHYAQAIASYQQALDLYRQTGGRHETTVTLRHLGDTHHAIGDLDRAYDAWQQALDILDDLHHADADQVRVKLKKLGR